MSVPPSARPPQAKRVPVERTHHGDTVVDEYAWLAVKDDPDTLPYLEAENEWTRLRTADQEPLRQAIFEEIRGRVQETEVHLPTRKGGYWYYSRTEEGKQYAIHCRRAVQPGETRPPMSPDGSPLPGEEILLDENVLAGDSEHLSLGTFDVSPDGRLLAYSVDYTGNERFTLKVRDLTTGTDLPDEIADVHYGSAWSADGTTLFYLRADDAWRAHQLWRHAVGAGRDGVRKDALLTPDAQEGRLPDSDAPDSDVLVYEEPDERFSVSIGLTRSERYLVLFVGSMVTTECYLIPADTPDAPPRLVAPRQQGVEYHVEHDPARERFLVIHNRDALDFALAWFPEALVSADRPADQPANEAAATEPGEPPAPPPVAPYPQWRPLIDHTPGQRLIDVDAFADAAVVSLRRDGLTALRVLPATGEPYDISFPEPIYTVALSGNPEYATGSIRIAYSSLITPSSIYDYDLGTREMTLLWRAPVRGGYDPEQYEQHRTWAVTPDGTRVPISIACRRGTPRDGSAPLLLYGYGSYEASMDPWFSYSRPSLLDRGVVFAIAHVRGGGELGRRWYEDGKLLAKRNTFTDFIACARHLVAEHWTSTDRLVAMGGSAGGLLMGAVANLEPTAFAGIVAQVPFVDVLTTILDPSLPLTVAEWEEWGNPLESAEAYHYIKSYAPYENLAARPYPPMLVLGSLNDTRVLYHEPAKFVARLRAVAPEADVLLKTEMGTGHGGPTGRYDAWRETAFIYAWIITRVGAPVSAPISGRTPS
ncbi:MAG: S9 family peptidase [Micromonosporaceae bacterium]|nr:S9 family peptidase [Micromonosporaceae bacterium]